MSKQILRKLNAIFKLFPKIKLVYFFGSRARGNYGPLSDYDFAVYLTEKDKKKIFRLQSKLLDKICRCLKTDNVDIVVLNTTESPELKYNIIKETKLIYEKEPFKVLVEPRILNEYFDFRALLLRHGLTSS